MEIQVEKEPEVELHEQNVIHDVVEFSRSEQVLNEEQSVVLLLTYITGLLPDHADYGAAMVTGGSSSGKTHLKTEVVDRLFALRKEWLFTTTSSSAKGLIDAEGWDDARIAALNELNKMPDEMLELIKSAHGDDGGFEYHRSAPDPNSPGGFTSAKITKDAKPVIFMLADENAMNVEAELQTRMLDIKVDETEDKNAAVHDMHWGHQHLTLPDNDTEYIFDAPELKFSLQHHIANIPLDTDVVIPTGEGRFEGDDWDAAAVVKPMFQFKRSESTRASRLSASLVKASALLNYHARDSVEIEVDGEMVEHIVVEPEDVANLIDCRKTLLSTTHDLNEKKLAILDAIISQGSEMQHGSGEMAATLNSIEEAIQNNPNIATFSKSELRELLDEMDEAYIIDITENPNDRRENLYVYGGGNSLGRPAIEEEWDHFETVVSPITEQPLKERIDEQQKRLGARSVSDIIEGPPEDGQKQLGGGLADEDSDDMSQLHIDVLGAMHETLDGARISMEHMDDVDYEHMLIDGLLDEEDGMLVPDGPANSDDIEGTLFDPDGWDDLNRNEVKAKIESVVSDLASRSKWYMEEDGDVMNVVVSAP